MTFTAGAGSKDHEHDPVAADYGQRAIVDLPGAIPPPENKQFYPALDGLRAVAVLLVFWGHYEVLFHPFMSWGWAGVDIFFALSGFLITGILYDTRDTAHRFRNFYARRTLRIFPLYYGVLVLALVTTPIFHWLWNPAWFLWFTYLGNYARFFYVDNPLFTAGAVEHLVAQPPFPHHLILFTGHLWSLCVEEQFYLIWPLVVFTVRKREHLRNLCAIVFVACLLARIECVYWMPGPLLHADFLGRVTPLRADALLIGGFAALCLRGPESVALQKLVRPLLAAFALGFLIFELTWIGMSPRHTAYPPDGQSSVLTTIGFSLIDIFAAALVVALIEPRGVLFRIFNLNWLRRLGKVSYGFYVFHDLFHNLYASIAHRLTHSHGPSLNLTSLIALTGTLLLSFLSYRYFETPFLRLKRHFIVKENTGSQ